MEESCCKKVKETKVSGAAVAFVDNSQFEATINRHVYVI